MKINTLIGKSDLIALQNDLLSAALSKNNLSEYSDYAFLSLHEYVKMDSASLNFCLIKDNIVLEELKCLFFRKSNKMEKSYEEHFNLDFVTPLVLNSPRVVIQGRDQMAPEKLFETDLFKIHCKPFDVYNAIIVGAKIPGHKYKYIVLYLYSEDPKRLFTPAEIDFVNSIFPVIFSTLLYKMGCICNETMIEQIALLDKFCGAPEMMRLIKLIVKKPSCTRNQYIGELNKEGINIKPGTLDSQFQKIFEKLGIREFNDSIEDDRDAKKQRNLNLKYQVYEKFMFLKN